MELAGQLGAQSLPVPRERQADVVAFPGFGRGRIKLAGGAIPKEPWLAVRSTWAEDRLEGAKLAAVPHDDLHVREGLVIERHLALHAGDGPVSPILIHEH